MQKAANSLMLEGREMDLPSCRCTRPGGACGCEGVCVYTHVCVTVQVPVSMCVWPEGVVGGTEAGGRRKDA